MQNRERQLWTEFVRKREERKRAKPKKSRTKKKAGAVAGRARCRARWPDRSGAAAGKALYV